MPQVIKVGAYVIYFWMDEGKPLEPIRVRIAEGVPRPNATKVWLTRSGKAILAGSYSDIPADDLRKLIRIVEANADLIREKWLEYFEDVRYYC